MAKKIRFPLEMEHGVEVRSLEELRENFSLGRVRVYLTNRKLLTWLRDRYEDDIADAIEDLDYNDSEFPEKLCELFGVEYNEDIVIDMEKAKERNRKLGILKEYTTDKKFFDVVDNVAFTQGDLYNLLDEEQNKIYLFGDKFNIPMSKKGMTYIGINNPIVMLDVKEKVNLEEEYITLLNVKYDDKYKKILETSKEIELNKKFDSTLKESKKHDNKTGIGKYSNSYLNFTLSIKDKKSAEYLYNMLVNEINSINYDIDADVSKVKQDVQSSGLIGLANSYIENL